MTVLAEVDREENHLGRPAVDKVGLLTRKNAIAGAVSDGNLIDFAQLRAAFVQKKK